MSRQDEVDKIAKVLCAKGNGLTFEQLAEYLFDNGIRSKGGFEIYRKWKGYGALMGDEVCGVKPKEYKKEEK